MAIGMQDEQEHRDPNEVSAMPGQPYVEPPAENAADGLGMAEDDVGNPDIHGIAPNEIPGDQPPEPPRFIRRQQHGYETVEVHENAVRVIRWDFIDEDEGGPSPADILKQREWFEIGEWLARLPISDSERAAYFDMKRVSNLAKHQ